MTAGLGARQQKKPGSDRQYLDWFSCIQRSRLFHAMIPRIVDLNGDLMFHISRELGAVHGDAYIVTVNRILWMIDFDICTRRDFNFPKSALML